MQVPYETLPLPEAGGAQVAEFFEQMINDGLPGFVLRKAAPNGYQLYKDIESVLAGYSYTRREEHAKPVVFEATVTGFDTAGTDSRLHVDERPTPNLPASIISAHHTNTGRLIANFFEFSDANDYFCRQGYGTDSMMDAHDLFLEGAVDDKVLNPKGYVCEIESGDMVAFRLSGENPLAHIFQSVDLPRRSTVVDFCMAQTVRDLLLAEKAS